MRGVRLVLALSRRPLVVQGRSKGAQQRACTLTSTAQPPRAASLRTKCCTVREQLNTAWRNCSTIGELFHSMSKGETNSCHIAQNHLDGTPSANGSDAVCHRTLGLFWDVFLRQVPIYQIRMWICVKWATNAVHGGQPGLQSIEAPSPRQPRMSGQLIKESIYEGVCRRFFFPSLCWGGSPTPFLRAAVASQSLNTSS